MVIKPSSVLKRARGFIRRQKHNYQVGVARASATSFLTGITNQYNAIYAAGLGADSVQLGSLSSIGSAIGSLLSLPIGWFVDRRGVRPFILVGIALSSIGALFYAIAQDWRILIVSVFLAAISTRLTGTTSSVICADSVENKDRATAQNVCGTLGAFAGMISPLVAAYLVTSFGGMNVEGIRSLYYLQFIGYALVLVFVAAKLREPLLQRQPRTDGAWGLVTDFRKIFAGKPTLRRWIVISAFGALPMAMF